MKITNGNTVIDHRRCKPGRPNSGRRTISGRDQSCSSAGRSPTPPAWDVLQRRVGSLRIRVCLRCKCIGPAGSSGGAGGPGWRSTSDAPSVPRLNPGSFPLYGKPVPKRTSAATPLEMPEPQANATFPAGPICAFLEAPPATELFPTTKSGTQEHPALPLMALDQDAGRGGHRCPLPSRMSVRVTNSAACSSTETRSRPGLLPVRNFGRGLHEPVIDDPGSAGEAIDTNVSEFRETLPIG